MPGGLEANKDSDARAVMETLAEEYGEPWLCDRVCEIIGEPEASHAHALLVRIPWRTIITTNYDRLIEKAYQQNSQMPVVCATESALKDVDSDLSRLRHPLIVKMHGDCIFRGAMIVRPSRIEEVNYEVSHPAIWSFLEQTLQHASAMFVGYSLRDENVKFLRKILQVKARHIERGRRRDYLIAIDPDSTDVARWRDDRTLTVIQLKATSNGLTKEECICTFLQRILDGLLAEPSETSWRGQIAVFGHTAGGKVSIKEFGDGHTG